jgi:predicted lipoprotein with Yx(FWY)xxD motif
MIRKTYALVLFAIALLATAGCGGSSSTETTATTEASSSETSAAAETSTATLSGESISGLGTVLVDSEGFTVYMFGKDKGTTSSCYGACAENWPPVTTTGTASAGEGAMSSEIGTTKRKDGTVQVTYAGHPLYTFTGDSSPGEATGNELNFFGGVWNALDESGAAVEGTASSEEESTTSESSGGGGGYGY